VEAVDEGVLSYLIDPQPDEPRLIIVHGSPGTAEMYSDYLHDPVPGYETIAVDRMGYGESRPEDPVTSFELQAASIEPLLEARAGAWPVVVGHSLGGPIRWYQKVARWRIVNPFLVDYLQDANVEAWATMEQVELLDPLLERITCPVVILHGTDDSLVPFETVEHSIERFTDNEHIYVMVMIGEGHSLTKLRSEELREVLTSLREGIVDFLPENEGLE
jgi:pimeloyl-ACP methyl ester carboxylesterase